MTEPTEKNKGGRPRVAEVRAMRGIRLSAHEWATLQAIGGADWLRERLARQKLTAEQLAARDALLMEAAGQQRLPDAP